MEALRKRSLPHLCLICGVDSGPIKTFIFFFMGSLVIAAAMFLIWAWATKRLGSNESFSSLAMDAENPPNNNAVNRRADADK